MPEKENVLEAPILDDNIKADFINALEASLNGKPVTDYQANLLFYWARHQNDKMFDFVPKRYRLDAESMTKRKKVVRK